MLAEQPIEVIDAADLPSFKWIGLFVLDPYSLIDRLVIRKFFIIVFCQLD